MPNRIKLALSGYGSVDFDWVIKWMEFQTQIAAYRQYAGLVLMKGSCYVHMNCNQLVATALDDEWEYLLMIQQDQIMPPGLLERIGGLTEPIVGFLTYGRVMENQAAVPGRFRVDGNFTRMTDDEVDELLASPGLHPCGAVGMGCTAIRRDVFEGWREERMPWFQVPSTPTTSYGEDVWFCKVAGELGFRTFVDSSLVSGHIGTWVSSSETYLASRALRRQRLAAAADQSPPGPKIPTWTTPAEHEALTKIACGKRALEIGAWKGHSAVSMALAGATVYAVDCHDGRTYGPGEDSLAELRANLELYGVRDRVVPLVGRSDQVLPMLQERSFDVVFVDGAHDLDTVFHDGEQGLRLLRRPGALAFHDYGRFEVGPAVRHLRQTYGLPEPEIVGSLAIIRVQDGAASAGA